MSRATLAVIGLGLAAGVGYAIWRYRRTRGEKAEETANGGAEAPEDRASQALDDASAEPARPPAIDVSEPAPASEPTRPPGPPASQGTEGPTTSPPASTPTPETTTTPKPQAPTPTPTPPPTTPTPTPRPQAPTSTPTMDLMSEILSAPKPKPAKPKPKPAKPKRSQKITRSTFDRRTGHVHQSPESLLEQARRVLPDLTLTEYTAARVIASEHYYGTDKEWAAIVDAELNRAPKQRSAFTRHIAPKSKYGYQGRGGRRVASTRDPTLAHVEIARRVLRGELRGISAGASLFFNPRTQAAMHKKWISGKSKRQHCMPATILRRWSFGHPWSNRKKCELNTAKTGRLMEWVGPIDGIDPLKLMLFRGSNGGKPHREQFDAAMKLLTTAGLA